MIAFVRGNLIEKFASSVVVEAGGVGYEIFVSRDDFANAVVNTPAKFYTFHAVRENAEELYGFASLAAKRLFEMLVTVQGVGPKAALAILSLGDAETVRNALANGDSNFVSRAAGVGKKTAERVVVDLRDKVGAASFAPSVDAATGAPVNFAGDEALDALMALGFGLADAAATLNGVSRELSTAERVRAALKQK